MCPWWEELISTYEALSEKVSQSSDQASTSNCQVVETEDRGDVNYIAEDAVSKTYAIKSSTQQTTRFFNEYILRKQEEGVGGKIKNEPID